MKMSLWLTSVLLSMSIASIASADGAVGVVLGDPTGLSGRLGLDGNYSLNGALAYAAGGRSGVYVHGTYIRDKARTFAIENSGPIEMYYGLGLRVIAIDSGKYDGDVLVGPRAPLGLAYNINNPNLEIFGELSVALDLVPRTDVDLDVGVGVRIRF